MDEKEYLEKCKNKPNDVPSYYWLQVKREKIQIHITWVIIVIILLCMMFKLSKPSKNLTPQERQEMEELKDNAWPPIP